MQFAALAGALLLYCAPFMVWWAPPLNPLDPNELLQWTLRQEIDWPIPLVLMSALQIVAIGSGLAAILLCFSPRPNPRRYYLRWILPFTTFVLALHLFNHLFSRPMGQSVFDDDSLLAAPFLQNLSTLFAYMRPGTYAAIAGLVLVGWCVWANQKATSLVPLAFAYDEKRTSSNRQRNEMLRFLLWVFALTPIASLLVWLLLRIPTEFSHLELNDLFFWLRIVVPTISTLPVGILGFWFLLKAPDWRRSFRPVAPRYFVIAIGVPLIAYVVPRIAYYFGSTVLQYFRPLEFPYLPTFGELFALPSMWAFLMLMPALLEEIGWRVYLQETLTAEFGLRRGLLLVGIAWATWHLPSEVGHVQLDGAALSILGRFVSVFAIMLPLAWLFVRTGSVIHVTIFHALYNILPSRFSDEPMFGRGWMGWAKVAVVALCGYWLFRRWPIDDPIHATVTAAEESEDQPRAQRSPN